MPLFIYIIGIYVIGISLSRFSFHQRSWGAPQSPLEWPNFRPKPQLWIQNLCVFKICKTRNSNACRTWKPWQTLLWIDHLLAFTFRIEFFQRFPLYLDTQTVWLILLEVQMCFVLCVAVHLLSRSHSSSIRLVSSGRQRALSTCGRSLSFCFQPSGMAFDLHCSL